MDVDEPDVAAPDQPSGRRPGARLGPTALTGLAAGALTVGVAELLAGVMQRLGAAGGTPSPLDAVGAAFVDLTPAWLRHVGIETFGVHDKTALMIGVGLVLVALSVAVGWLRTRSPRLAVALLLGLVVVAALAVISRAGSTVLDLVPLALGAGAGSWVLVRSRAERGPVADHTVSRRTLLESGALLTVLGVAGIAAGRVVAGGARAAQRARAAFVLPRVASRVSVPAGADLGVAGVTPFVVPNADFYRIDTALVVPRIDPQEWSLRVVGMVDREVTLDWATLLGKPMQESMVTLMCVSNEVGGRLCGNAIWTGWPVRELLREAGVRPGADMVLSRSADGWTAGTPLEALTDDRDALLVVAQNGEALLPEHGYPVRLVVPGLYGYVSATKWVTELEVTTFAADEGYWTPRGWSALGPVKTQSRIDVPTAGARVAQGTVAVAGVAWAQHRGIAAVEVQVDDGPWRRARLGTDATVDAWRQWVYSWEATPGEHHLTVRATDRDGQTQTSATAEPAPDGATGYHRISVTVG